MIYNKAAGNFPANAIYVGRGTRWGNPFKMANGSEKERDRVIEAFRIELWRRIKAGEVTVADLASLHGKGLVCHCAPKRCHADILARAAAWAVTQL